MALRQTISLYDPRGSRVETPPTLEPVSAQDLRDHLREAQGSLSDAAANEFITAAREAIEEDLAIAMIDQSWQLTLDKWPQGHQRWWDGVEQGDQSIIYADSHLLDVQVPRWPLQSITTVTAYDEDGTSTAVVVADTFDVDIQSLPGRITLKRGATWPVALRSNNAIEIVYLAGYGPVVTDVPAGLKLAVKNLAAAFYSNRGDCSADAVLKTPSMVSILSKYRTRRI